MIDISSEQLLPLTEVRAFFPDRPSTTTVWRWRTKGSRGRRLESVVLGGKVYTSLEAIQRFAEQLGGTDAPTVRTPAARERGIRRAEDELNDAGI